MVGDACDLFQHRLVQTVGIDAPDGAELIVIQPVTAFGADVISDTLHLSMRVNRGSDSWFNGTGWHAFVSFGFSLISAAIAR